MSDIVVIGYGNELRGDDGVGPHVARAIARRHANIRVIATHQLTPELAECLAQSKLAIFVDACENVRRADVLATPLAPAAISDTASHDSSPRSLLDLALTVYGRAPAAWLVTVPAFDLSHREGLSAATSALAEAACVRIEKLLAANHLGVTACPLPVEPRPVKPH